ncbi:uncharacterized protein [Zea mays]|uniref:Uncharacterized protein n=1 Tax=Zea mays TaxID=4577 RepID=A0A1D6FPK4_MAIZE|nr:uncharacterized protein LOC103635615 [Zea mays]AQK93557.1 hypothetical protein ZEAMMB73_Zm00001d010170 [Zea mays]|eukprot:XP_008656250.1 uncharacterized protein LOC103635615 [Zea mays]
MGNCGTKPKTSDGDDAPPPVEAQVAAGAAEGERKDDEEVAAPEGTSQALVAPQTEEVTTTTVEEKEHAEPNEKTEEFGKEDADHGEEKETPPPTEAPELPASTPASVA